MTTQLTATNRRTVLGLTALTAGAAMIATASPVTPLLLFCYR